MPKPTPARIDVIDIAQRHQIPTHAIFQKGLHRARNRAARAEFAKRLIDDALLSNNQAAAVMGPTGPAFHQLKKYEPPADMVNHAPDR